MVEPAVPFYGLRFRIFEPEVRFRHFAHTMGSMLINKVHPIDQIRDHTMGSMLINKVKHGSSFGKLRTKKSRFVSKKKGFTFSACQRQAQRTEKV